jgi:hypothetical protein
MGWCQGKVARPCLRDTKLWEGEGACMVVLSKRCWSKIWCGKILNELIWKGDRRKYIIYLKLSNDHVGPTRFGNFKTR